MARLLTIIALVWLAALTPLNAQENAGLALFDSVKQKAEAALEHPATEDATLAGLRKSLEALDKEAKKILAPLLKAKADAEGQLAALGPVPEGDQPPESPEIADKREKLQEQLLQLDTRIKATEFKRLEAQSLIKNIANYRSAQFVDRLLYRGPAPLNRGVWEGAWRQSRLIYQRMSEAVGNALRQAGFGGEWRVVSVLAAGGVLAYFIGFPIRRFLIRIISHGQTDDAPTYSQRIREAVLVGLARSLPVLLALLVLAVSLKFLFPFTENGNRILFKTVLGTSLYAIVIAFSRTVFKPKRSQWRIPAMSDAASLAALKRVQWLALIPAVDIPLEVIGEIYEASRSLISVHDFLITLLAAIPIVGLTRGWLWQPQAALPQAGEVPGSGAPMAQKSGPRYPLLRFLTAVAAIVAPIAALFGYTELGYYLTTRLVESAALISVLILAYLISQDLFLIGLTRTRGPEESQTTDDSPPSGAPALHFWWSLGFGLIFSILGIGGLAILWGVAQDDLASWAEKLITGIEIGGMTFSLIDIVVAVLVFAVVYMVTRFIQRMLANKILPMTRLDRGAQDSLRTMVGYVGFTIAAFAGISTAGFDLTNLAIIAGALSLGIGFGLQNVVNNFVSGLILLVERPIKVGDWVIAGSAQGYVKRIMVRATEIETFDKATVIIPNSELISAPVTNWFFRDRGGRVVIPIGVAYGSDPEKVRDILFACVRENPRVLRYPAPSVYLVNFGDSSLDFSLRIHLGDIDWMVSTASEVRFEILKRFAEENIEIPFPQRDINLRDLDRLETALKPAGTS